MSDHSIKPIRILRVREVAERSGISRSLLCKFVREGKFPPSVKIGERAAGWLESDVAVCVTSRSVSTLAANQLAAATTCQS
jgi:prophage regulatory protein